MPGRRALAFDSLDAVMPDVDRLLQGYEAAGKWSLGQVCYHLATGLRYTAEGGLPVRVPWPRRVFLGRLVKWYIFKKGGMPEGVEVPASVLSPSPSHDDRAEAEALRATIVQFLQAPEPFAPHPLFGRLSGDEWRRFHCIHCAHHLSFLVPG